MFCLMSAFPLAMLPVRSLVHKLLSKCCNKNSDNDNNNNNKGDDDDDDTLHYSGSPQENLLDDDPYSDLTDRPMR